MASLSFACVLLASIASTGAANDSNRARLGDAAALSQTGAAASDPAAAKTAADAALDGSTLSEDSVSDDGTRSIAKRKIALTKATDHSVPGRDGPPAPAGSGGKGELSTGLMLGGAGLIGGLQGWFSAGLAGAASGALLCVGAAWLFHKKDYGGALGITLGGIIGTAFGGPIGGLVGAVVGGLAGHFIGKMFFGKKTSQNDGTP